MGTPASYAARTLFRELACSRRRWSAYAGNRPAPAAIPGKLSMLIKVGTRAVPRRTISAISSAFRPVPCSRQSTPAASRSGNANSPKVCTVTRAPAAVARAHAAGARVTVHTFGELALPDLLAAGVDCLEHGTGLNAELIAEMVRRGTALVPTLINIDNFPGIAAGAGRFPAYAEHLRRLHASSRNNVRAAYDAGVPIYAGTDAGVDGH